MGFKSEHDDRSNTWKRDLESFLDRVPEFERVEKELNRVLYF